MKHGNCVSRPPEGRTPHAAGPRRPTVLFALFEQGQPTASLLRAFAHARMLEADLRVLRVLPEATHVNVLFPQGNAMEALQDMEQALRVDSETRDWLGSCLGERAPAVEQFSLVHGDFVDQVAQQAADLGAVLIVIPPRDGGVGGVATALARTTGVPVLLAREVRRGRTIVAAADLENDDCPVLLRASELALRLAAPVLAIHNLDLAAAPINDSFRPAAMRDEWFGESRVARLAQVTRGLPADAQAVIHRDESSVDAILQEARNHEADLIVVGTRSRSWFDRLVDDSVAERVVDRARRSVLVLPVDEMTMFHLFPLGQA